MEYLERNPNKPGEYMGLNNKLCTNPVYYCKAHRVYLNNDDVTVKKCLCKPTMDLISTQRCNWLIPINDM